MPVVLLLVAAGAALVIAGSRRREHEVTAEHMVILAPFSVRFQQPGGPARDLFTAPYPGIAANAYEALRSQLLARGAHGQLSLCANTPSSHTELRVEIL